jgi:hypothetical protein
MLSQKNSFVKKNTFLLKLTKSIHFHNYETVCILPETVISKVCHVTNVALGSDTVLAFVLLGAV